jgi:hypothetical protein
MATAKIVQIGKGSLDPGKETTKGWNNPPLGNVLGFWVQPSKLPEGGLLVGQPAFQITKVETKMDKPDHFVVRVTVKNTGDLNWEFELFMSFLG